VRASSTLGDLARSRELLTNLTLRELRGKYKRSAIGWAWSLLNPLATMAIFSVVFLFFLKVPTPVGDPSGLQIFALYLLCGLLPWNLVANGMSGGMAAILGNANLIKKVFFPREVLVGASVASWVFSLLIEVGVLAVALVVVGNMVLPWLPLVALVVVAQTCFVLGIALLLSVLNVYFRDTQHLVAILTQFWFYATPIVYPMSLVSDAAKDHSFPIVGLYELNPMVRFVEIYRNLLYDLRFPAAVDVAYVVGVSVLTLLAGYLVFRRLEPKLAEEL